MGINVRYITADVQGQSERTKPVIDSLKDVPEAYRADGCPSYAGSFGVGRTLFNWLNKLGLVKLWLHSPEDGVYVYSVRVLRYFGWQFATTPELSYLMVQIVHGTNREEWSDVLFTFRGRKMFVPFEIAYRFCESFGLMVKEQPERIMSLHMTLNSPAPDTEDNDEGKEKRVLH